MAAYLIDFENVKSEGIKGILQLTEKDTVIIFYSVNADTLTFETMDMIFNSKAKLKKYKIIHGGKNSLDFQLTTYLGYLIHEGTDNCFYIISNDHGFQHVVEFWKRIYGYKGYVFCSPTIADAIARQKRFDSISGNKARSAEMEKEQEEQITEADETLQQEEEEEAELLASAEGAESPQVQDSESIAEPEQAESPAADQEVHDAADNHTGVYVNESGEAPDENAFHPAAAEALTENISVRLPDDSVMIETIHGTEPVSGVPQALPEEKEDDGIAAQLARKVAEAVPDSGFRASVVNNDRTIHNIMPEETETVTAVTSVEAVPAEPEEAPADFDAEADEKQFEASATSEKSAKAEPHRTGNRRTHHRKRTASSSVRTDAVKAEGTSQAEDAEKAEPKKNTAAPEGTEEKPDAEAGRKAGQAGSAEKKSANTGSGQGRRTAASRNAGYRQEKVEKAETPAETPAAEPGTSAGTSAEAAKAAPAEASGTEARKPRRQVRRRTSTAKSASARPAAEENRSEGSAAEAGSTEEKPKTAGRSRGRRPKKVSSGAAAFKDGASEAE